MLAQIHTALRECAVQLQLLPDFVTCSVALLSRHLSDAATAAAALQQLLGLVRLGGAGAPEAPFPPLSAPMELTLETSQELLTCRAEFASTQLAVGEGPATLRLFLASSLAVPLPITELQVRASPPRRASAARTTAGLP